MSTHIDIETQAPWKVRIAVPERAAAGELVEIRTLIAHPMFSGFSMDNMGRRIERDILTRLECRYAGELVMRADLQPAIAANPYVSFYVRASQTGELVFVWTDQHGAQRREVRMLTVTSG